jgi:hypothetical protein
VPSGRGFVEHDMQQPESIERDRDTRLLSELREIAGISIARGNRERVFWPGGRAFAHLERRGRQNSGRRRKCLARSMLGDKHDREPTPRCRERHGETYAAATDDNHIRAIAAHWE